MPLGDAEPSFCPELGQKSCPLHVSSTNSDQHESVGRLSLFQHTLVANNSAGVLYAGGHISAIDFHPSSKTLCALAAHRQDTPTHKLLKIYKGHAHIQLWSLSLIPGYTHCVGILPHNGNCTWDLKWRPQPFPSHPSLTPPIGTLAAALGDGTAIITTFQDSDLPYMDAALKTSSPPTSVLTLSPKIITLRAHKKAHQRNPVRVVQWSPDGGQIVLGIANGTIEVYEVNSPEGIWPRWCVPAQDSLITGIRWFSPSHICSVSIACVLRLRDMRNPVDSLEQNTEGLSGCRTVDTIEPSVAVVGTECGTLRIIRLETIDGIQVKQPVKRIYLQKNSLRDVQSSVEDEEGTTTPYTLVYAGGTEGVVHECILPRPMWPKRETCHLPRASILQKIRWTEVENKKDQGVDSEATSNSGDKDSGLNLYIGHQDHNTRSLVSTDRVCDEQFIDKRNGMGHTVPTVSKRTRVPGPNGMDRETYDSRVPLFGEDIVKRTTITRIALSQDADLVIVGMDDGFLSWVPMKGGETKQLNLPKTKMPGYVSAPKKKAFSGKKRGRPRKHLLRPVRQPRFEEVTDEESVDELLAGTSVEDKDSLQGSDSQAIETVSRDTKDTEGVRFASRKTPNGANYNKGSTMSSGAGKKGNAAGRDDGDNDSDDDDDEFIANLRRPTKRRKTPTNESVNENENGVGVSRRKSSESGGANLRKERLLAAVRGGGRRKGSGEYRSNANRREERQNEYVKRDSKTTRRVQEIGNMSEIGIVDESNSNVQNVERNQDAGFIARTNVRKQTTRQGSPTNTKETHMQIKPGIGQGHHMVANQNITDTTDNSGIVIKHSKRALGSSRSNGKAVSSMSIPLKLRLRQRSERNSDSEEIFETANRCPSTIKPKNDNRVILTIRKKKKTESKLVTSRNTVTQPQPQRKQAELDRGLGNHMAKLPVLLKLRLRQPCMRTPKSANIEQRISTNSNAEVQTDEQKKNKQTVYLRLRLRQKQTGTVRNDPDAEKDVTKTTHGTDRQSETKTGEREAVSHGGVTLNREDGQAQSGQKDVGNVAGTGQLSEHFDNDAKLTDGMAAIANSGANNSGNCNINKHSPDENGNATKSRKRNCTNIDEQQSTVEKRRKTKLSSDLVQSDQIQNLTQHQHPNLTQQSDGQNSTQQPHASSDDMDRDRITSGRPFRARKPSWRLRR